MYSAGQKVISDAYPSLPTISCGSTLTLSFAPTSIYAEAAKRATAIIPIVFIGHADPLGSRHVASLANPGGNLTGTSLMMTDTNAKGLQLLKEAVPGLSQVATIYDPGTPSHVPGLTCRAEYFLSARVSSSVISACHRRYAHRQQAGSSS